MTHSSNKKIAIIGGGITGLSAAWYIRRMFKERGIEADITLFEKADVYGGKIRTLRKEGCVIEQGPDSFLARKLPMIELAGELGLENELTAVNPDAKTFILHKGKPNRMPQGLMLGVPTELMPFVSTGLISPLGKLRAALDFVLPRRRAEGDESLGGFLRRRLGSEIATRIAEPLLAGIYAGDTDELSLQATFPQFAEFERRHRSVILGMARSRKAPKTAPDGITLPSAAKGATFLTYRKGLGTLIDALALRLQNIHLLSGQSVQSVTREDGQIGVRTEDGADHRFDAVVVTVPNYEAAAMIKPLAANRSLIDIPYASVANVVLAYRKADVASSLNGSGFVVPRGEGLTITACTLTSVKWLHTAPGDIALVRCYVGRAGDERGMSLDDGELFASVQADLHATLGIVAQPLFVEFARWRDSMPQYTVGHLDRLKQYRDKLREALPGVYIAGAGYEGVGLPDCITQGRRSAESVVAYCIQQDREER